MPRCSAAASAAALQRCSAAESENEEEDENENEDEKENENENEDDNDNDNEDENENENEDENENENEDEDEGVAEAAGRVLPQQLHRFIAICSKNGTAASQRKNRTNKKNVSDVKKKPAAPSCLAGNRSGRPFRVTSLGPLKSAPFKKGPEG